MNKKQVFAEIRKHSKRIVEVSDGIVEGKKHAKKHKDMTTIERDFYYKELKKKEKDLVEALRLFNTGIESVVTELKEAYDILTILPPEYDEFLKENEKEYKESLKKQAEVSKRGVRTKTRYLPDGTVVEE